MIHIKKTHAPPHVERQLQTINRSPEWTAISADRTEVIRSYFDTHAPKKDLRTCFRTQQHDLCAYCMSKLPPLSAAIGFPLEHWLPLSVNKSKVFDYRNLLGVCDGGANSPHDKKGTLCCDAAKGNKQIRFDPQNKSHIKLLSYSKKGHISVGNDEYIRKNLLEKTTTERNNFVYGDLNLLILLGLQHFVMWRDINCILKLNGELDGEYQTKYDAYTNLVLGRKNTYTNCCSKFDRWDKKGKLTSATLKTAIDKIQTDMATETSLPEFVGVTLYFMEKKYRQLLAQGK